MSKRRGRGEGSVYYVEKRARWAVTVTLEGGKRKTLYGASKAAVLARKREIERAVDAGLPITSERTTVGAYLETWLAGYAARVRHQTFVGRRIHIRRHIVPALGTVKLAKLSAGQVAAFYGQLQTEKRLSGRTVRGVHSTLRLALGEAVKAGELARNVTAMVELPRVAPAELTVWTSEQVRRFLEAAQTDRYYGLYALALGTGMRQGELLGLRWRDVDLEAGRLTVNVSLRNKSGRDDETVLQEPKTRRSRRTLLLPPHAVEALRHHRRMQLEERLAAGPLWTDWRGAGLVFPTPLGTPTYRFVLYRASFLALLERAGVPRIRFHDLRHTAATQLLAAGADPLTVSRRLGHSSVAFTLEVYGHVMPDMEQRAVDIMERLLAGV